ncbi:MAG: TIGR03435 family protein [Bryobacteraceae bacterium]
MKATCICLFGAAGFVLLGQSRPATAPLAFEVASVKPSVSGNNGVRGGCHGIDSTYTARQQAEAPPLGRCVITDGRLSHLIAIAWSLGSMLSLKSGPEWIAGGVERFNVEAKSEDPTKTTEQQLLTMLQNLLVDRFQLKYHRETAEKPGFALLVGKNGSKLQESKSEETRMAFSGPDGAAMLKPGPGQPISMKARKVSMAMLVSVLSGIGGHGQGVDKTGLQGEYDFTLSWDEDAGPSLSTALGQQLGLRLESQKVPTSYFVVDSAQRPSAN